MTSNGKAILAVLVIGLSWLFGGVVGSNDLWYLWLILLYVPAIVGVIIYEMMMRNGFH